MIYYMFCSCCGSDLWCARASLHVSGPIGLSAVGWCMDCINNGGCCCYCYLIAGTKPSTHHSEQPCCAAFPAVVLRQKNAHSTQPVVPPVPTMWEESCRVGRLAETLHQLASRKARDGSHTHKSKSDSLTSTSFRRSRAGTDGSL